MMTECTLPLQASYQTGSRNSAGKVIGTCLKPEDYGFSIEPGAPDIVDDATGWLHITITARGHQLMEWFTRQAEDAAKDAANALIKRLGNDTVQYRNLSLR